MRGRTAAGLLSRFNKINGRHEETRTPDLYRVNFEVINLKPFPYLAFPHLIGPKIPQKRTSFDGELMASWLSFPTSLGTIQKCKV